MNCCSNCFKDKEVVSMIEYNATQNGDCDFCGAFGVSIMPAMELYDIFEELFLSYALPKENDVVDSSFKLMYQHLKDWGLFNLSDDIKLEHLVQEIGSKLYFSDKQLFVQEVAPKILLDPSYKDQAFQYVEVWENFKKEIKDTNRFFINNSLNLGTLQTILTQFSRTYKKGKVFYRARISESGGIALPQMGKPPAKLASAGRANPMGISYLYLSNDIRTTVYEVRATLYDYVTIAQFKLKAEIKVASLRNVEKISPFVLPDINTYLLYKQFILHLESDLIKPLRRHDSELDYLPTQYLCEFIKSLGFDGIEYSSSLNTDGFNLALFFDNKVEPLNSEIYEVQRIVYDYQLT